MQPGNKFYTIQCLKIFFFGKGAVKKYRVGNENSKNCASYFLMSLVVHCKGAAKVPYEKCSVPPFRPL